MKDTPQNRHGACLVIGAGDDTGTAIARAFARDGLIACVVRRDRHTDALEDLARSIRKEMFFGKERLGQVEDKIRSVLAADHTPD